MFIICFVIVLYVVTDPLENKTVHLKAFFLKESFELSWWVHEALVLLVWPQSSTYAGWSSEALQDYITCHAICSHVLLSDKKGMKSILARPGLRDFVSLIKKNWQVKDQIMDSGIKMFLKIE